MTSLVNNNVKYLNWHKVSFPWGYEPDWCWVNATFYSCPHCIIDMTDWWIIMSNTWIGLR